MNKKFILLSLFLLNQSKVFGMEDNNLNNGLSDNDLLKKALEKFSNDKKIFLDKNDNIFFNESSHRKILFEISSKKENSNLNEILVYLEENFNYRSLCACFEIRGYDKNDIDRFRDIPGISYCKEIAVVIEASSEELFKKIRNSLNDTLIIR